MFFNKTLDKKGILFENSLLSPQLLPVGTDFKVFLDELRQNNPDASQNLTELYGDRFAGYKLKSQL